MNNNNNNNLQTLQRELWIILYRYAHVCVVVSVILGLAVTVIPFIFFPVKHVLDCYGHLFILELVLFYNVFVFSYMICKVSWWMKAGYDNRIPELIGAGAGAFLVWTLSRLVSKHFYDTTACDDVIRIGDRSVIFQPLVFALVIVTMMCNRKSITDQMELIRAEESRISIPQQEQVVVETV